MACFVFPWAVIIICHDCNEIEVTVGEKMKQIGRLAHLLQISDIFLLLPFIKFNVPNRFKIFFFFC